MKQYGVSCFCAAIVLIWLGGCITVNFKEQSFSQIEEDSRLELAREMKDFQAQLGWAPTKNFLRYDESLLAYAWCGQSGELDFHTEWSQIPQAQCDRGESGYDRVFYEWEAVAGVEAPLSRSMLEASIPRFYYLVFHEDFHEQVEKIPSRSIDESATQLMGFLAARDFIEQKYGIGSPLYHIFASEIESFLVRSQIKKRHYEALVRLYEGVAKKRLPRTEALRQKKKIYETMEQECRTMVSPILSTCASEMGNNVAFAQQIQYAMHYPLFYDLHRACGENTKRTGDIIIRLAALEYTENEFIRRIETLIKKGCVE